MYSQVTHRLRFLQLVLGASLFATATARAAELAASLEADVSFASHAGQKLTTVQAGEGFVISVKLKDVVSGAAYVPKDGLQAWIRRVEKTNIPCRQAARNYRAAEGRLPLGALDLNGTLIASLTREGNIHVLSPKLDLAQANIIFSSVLKQMPGAMVYQPVSRALYVSQPDSGEVLWVRPFETRLTAFASGLAKPTLLAAGPRDSLWVYEQGLSQVTRFSGAGQRLESLPFTGTAGALQAAGPYVLALGVAGTLSVFDSRNLKTVFAPAATRKITAAQLFAGPSGNYVLFLEADKATMSLVYLDRPDIEISIPLPAVPGALAVSPDGKWAFAFDAQKEAISVVDIAAAATVTGLTFKTGISEVTFAEGNAFFRLSNNKGIGSLRLDSIAFGKEPTVALSDFGIEQGVPKVGERLLLPLRGGYLVAVQSGSEAGFVVNARMQLSRSLPQTGMRFRGGLPYRIEAVENGFTAGDDGTLQTSAMLVRPGEHELVLTTGIQGLTTCMVFTVAGSDIPSAERRLSIKSVSPERPIRPGETTVLHFAMEMDGKPFNLPVRSKVRLVHLQGGWRKIFLSQSANQHTLLEVNLPLPGTYIVQPLGLPPNLTVVAAPQLEVEP